MTKFIKNKINRWREEKKMEVTCTYCVFMWCEKQKYMCLIIIGSILIVLFSFNAY